MAGKLLHSRAIHEASHAVIARKLGLAVQRVDVLSSDGVAVCHSAAHDARDRDVRDRIDGHEKDAIVALAGNEANRRELPHISSGLVDLLSDDDDADVLNTRSNIFHMIRLADDKPLPAPGVMITITPDEATLKKFYAIRSRLLQTTAALVEQHWPAIERVGKHLERHRRIDDQVELDDLIARGERLTAVRAS